MTAQVPAEMATKIAQAWKDGQTISEMQVLFGVSRQTLATSLRLAGIDPRNWRERNRAIGKPVGPGSTLKSKLEGAFKLYVEGISLAVIAEKFGTSRSSVRRVLLAANVVLRKRGRPVKGLPRL